MTTTDPKNIARRGYDALSHHYRTDDAPEGRYQPWIAGLRQRLPAHSTVLDLGCGCGVPVARSLATAGYAVTGVDLSDVQIRRARQLVPSATFIRADATTVDFPARSFGAVVCLYALIHMPLDEQPPLLARIATWLRVGGWFLATTGHRAWTGTQDNWLAGGATMWWSHADTATYRSWTTHAGLIIHTEDLIPEGTSGGGSAPSEARVSLGDDRGHVSPSVGVHSSLIHITLAGSYRRPTPPGSEKRG